eukprot:273529-Prymnesium_polylepis.1
MSNRELKRKLLEAQEVQEDERNALQALQAEQALNAQLQAEISSLKHDLAAQPPAVAVYGSRGALHDLAPGAGRTSTPCSVDRSEADEARGAMLHPHHHAGAARCAPAAR